MSKIEYYIKAEGKYVAWDFIEDAHYLSNRNPTTFDRAEDAIRFMIRNCIDYPKAEVIKREIIETSVAKQDWDLDQLMGLTTMDNDYFSEKDA